MADDKKRTLRGVYDGLQKISKEEGVDFGIGKYNYEDFEKKYGTKNNLSLLWKSLSDISNESGLDFGIGTADEWLQSFAYDGSSRVVDGNRMPAAVAVGAGMQQPAVQVPFVQGGKSASVSKPKSQSLYAGMNYDATKRSVNNATYDTSSHTMRGVGDEQRALTAEEKATLKERQGATREQAKEVRGQIESGVADVKERRRMQEAAMNELRRRIDPIEADKIAISNGLYKGMGKAGLRYNPQTRRMEKVPDDYGMSEKTDDELKEIISGNITVKDNRNYKAADRALRNAERMIAEADHNANGGFEGSFVAGAARGFGQKFGDASTWDLGITDLGDNLAFMDVLKKADQGKALTESEQTMLDSKVLEIATSEYFGSELGRGYKAGGVTAESIPFMVEMMVNPLAGAGKGAENMLARYAMKRFGKKAVEKEIKKNIKKGMTKEAAEAAARQTAAPIAKRAAAIAEKDLGYKIAKGAVRGAGDIAAAAGIAATTGAVRTVADAVDRMSGDVHFKVDAAGHNVFDYVDNKKDWLTAFREAYLGTMIENYSEMFGNYFGPLLGWFGKGAGHVGKALRLDRVQDALNNMSRSDWARLVGDFEKRAQWHGGIGEFAEEIVGGVINSIFVGDQTLDTDKQTGVFNLDNLIDTFLGVGLMSGAFSAVKTGGYAYGRHRLNKADAAGREAFGDDWDDMQKSLTVEDDAAVKARLKEIYNDGNLTQEQKRAAYEYAGRAAGFRGMLQSRSQAKEEPEANPTEQAVMESFDNGYEQAVEPEAREDVYTWLKGAREELRQMVGDEMLERIEEEPLVVKAEMEQDGAVDDNVMQAVNDYIAGRAFTEGVEQRIRDDAEDEADAKRAELQKKVNPVDGNVHPAMMVVDGQETEVYHVDGNVMMDDQGAMDAEKSDLTVVVYNPVTGKREMVDPKLLTFGAVQSGDALEEQISADAAARVEREINTAQGRITAGMQFPMEDGVIATVTAVNGNDVEYVRPDGQTGTLPLDQTQAIIDGALVEKYQQKYGSRQQEERQQQQDNVMEGVPEMEDIEPEMVLVMKDGRRLVVLGWSKTQKNSDTGRWEQVLADDGKNLAYYDMETPDKVQYAMKPQDIIKDVVGYIPVAEESAEEVTETPAESAAEESAQETETVGESAEEETAAEEPAEEKTPAQEMYEAVVAKHGAKAGHKIEITINEVDKLVDGKKKAVDTAQKKLDDAPVIGNAEAKAQAALDKALAAYDEALAQRKLWYEVKIIHDDVMKAERAAQEEERAKRRAAYEEQRKAEEAQRAAEEEEARKRKEEAREQSMRRAKEQEELDMENEVFDDVRKELGGEYMRGAIDRKRAIDEQVSMKQKRAKAIEIYGEFYNDDLETPADVYEYVASKLPGMKINWDMVDGKFGVLQEIGSNMSRRGGKNNGEFNGFDSLISFDNTGVSFQQAAHNMWDNAENIVDGGYKLFDEQDIRNAMIELLSSSENVSDITQYAFKNRVNNAEEMLEQSNGESLSREVEWRIQQSGMTFAEYMAWYKDMKDKAAAVDGMTEEEYNNIILGEYGNRETEESIDGAQPSAPVVGEERPRESGDDRGSGEEGAEEMRGTEGEPAGTVSDSGRGDEEAAGGEGSRGNGEVEQKNQDNNGQTERTDIDRRDTGDRLRDAVHSGAQRGDSGVDIGSLAEGLAAERSGDRGRSQRADEEAVGHQIIENAKKSGVFIDRSTLNSFGERVRKPSGESVVYVDKPNNRVVKVKDPYAKDNLKGHAASDALYEHIVHNLLFPNTQYRLIGISDNSIGDVRFVLEQDIIKNTTPATQQDIDWYLINDLGLTKVEKPYLHYENDYYSITDVEASGDNVFIDGEGVICFIDPIIKFKKPAKEVINYLNTGNAIAAAEAEVDTNPTEGQKEAGNYKKGHIKLDGYDITIEQPKGSVRSGVDPDGKAWSQEMHNTYGYIRGTEGVDGDHIDVFLSDDPQTGDVFVVDQVNKDGSFDEHKVMYGFPDIESARKAYLSNYEEGWQGLGAITPVSKEEFKKWIESSHRKTKPFSEYKSVETLGDVQVENMPAGEHDNERGAYRPITNEWFEVGDNVGFYVNGKVYHGDIIDWDGEQFTIRETISKRQNKYKDHKAYPVNIKSGSKKTSSKPAVESDEKPTAEQQVIGQAMVDQLENLGMEVSTDIVENRRVLKQAEKDNSEAGKLRHFRSADGNIYGFTYRGKLYLDPRRIDAELPIHEYAHPWCEAMRYIAPERWQEVVGVMKADAETWETVKAMNPELTDENDIAEEMIATYSGKNGKAKAQAEYERIGAKGNFGNMWQNIAKAIQDFWKKVGDFLDIKYESAEQVYDQVVKDFANRVNPRKRIEDYLKARDEEYMKAVEAGDEARAKELFDEALRENIGNGMTPYVSVGGYRGDMAGLARGVKSRDKEMVRKAAELLAPIIPQDAVLVPAPSHTGEATDMLDLANAIAEITGVSVANVLKSEVRASQYQTKKETGRPITSDKMGITMEGELPEGKIPVVIDNVVDSGNTAEACIKALGTGVVVSIADASDRLKHVSSLKSANPVVRDRNGNVVPLSKRFELGGSKYLAKQKVDGEAVKQDEAGNAVSDFLDEVLGKIFGKDYMAAESDNEVAQAEMEITNGGRVVLNRAQKRALETAYVSRNQKHQPAVISSADKANGNRENSTDNGRHTSLDISESGAKVLKNIDILAKKYSEKSNNPRHFIEDVSNTLGAKGSGSSKYATFVAKNGTQITIRLSNHNATVSTFDKNEEDNGISVVVSGTKNNGIKNNGNAHIVEFFYPEKKLRKADGKVLYSIIKSIEQSLYSGEYKDQTGIAEREEVNEHQIRKQMAGPVFVSNAMRAVYDIKQEKATAEQWLKMIEKNGGLKSGEDKWTGLSEWLKEKGNASLTKQEVIDYLFENAIDVEEVEYAENVDMREQTEEFIQETFADGKSIEELQEEVDANAESADRYDRLGDDPEQSELDEYLMKCMVYEYGDDFRRGYVIKDGKIECDPQAFIDTEDTVEYNSEVAGDDNKAIDPTRLDYTTGGLKNKREIALTVPNIESWGENDVVHFGDAGYGRAIGWARFGETTDKDGNRVLVIDEIQSKRHQEGREKGYKMPAELQRLHRKMQSGNITNEEVARYNELAQQEGSTKTKQLLDASVKAQDDYDAYMQQMSRKYGVSVMNVYSIMSGEDQKEADRLEKAVYDADAAYQNYSPSDIPDAPFDKNWHELVMKRMLRYAAENGYDKVAWTTGEQQAERYDLSKSIKDMTATGWTDYSAVRGDDAKEAKLIAINTIDGGEYAQLLVDKSGKVLSDVDDRFVGKQLSDVVGKDLAKRLMEDGYQTIEGDGLRIGGEGMKGFYDQILPRFMDKYGKKWGVKTGEVELPELGDNGLTMWSVDVTPEMKQSVMEGQPMFQKVWHGSGADFDRFDHSKMGSGEGVQAFGWGTYVTQVEGIGRSYAQKIGDKSSPATFMGVSAEALAFKNKDFFDSVGATDEDRVSTLMGIVSSLNYGYGDPVRMIQAKRESLQAQNRSDAYISGRKTGELTSETDETKRKRLKESISYYEEKIKKTNSLIEFTDSLNPADFKGWSRNANHVLYEVEIPDDNDGNYLEWDKKPSKEVREKIQKALDDAGQKHIIGKEAEGQRIYKELSGLLGSDKAASEFLHNAGFTGIKYPAQYRSGGREDNAKNYVIFDDGDIKINNKTRFFRTADGTAYGFTKDGKIYVDKRIATPETRIHEYAHLWAQGLKKRNEQAWEQLKSEMQQQADVMEYVKRLYPELAGEGAELTDEMMEEVFAHYSGKRGAERLRQEMEAEMAKANGIIEKARVANVFHTIREILSKFWEVSRDLFAGKVEGIEKLSGEDFADMMLGDLLGGFDPRGPKGGMELTAEDAGKTWANVYGKGKTIDAVMREGDAVAGEPRSYEDALRVARAAGYTKKQFDAKIERQERAARKRFDDLVEKLNLGDRVTIVETIDELDGLNEATREARRNKKGWYNKKSGKIVVILGNHRSPDDVVKTILHEGVAHHGLRAMFGERFDTFLDNVYDAASDNVRQRIDESAERHGWDKRTATEEYLASLAEDADFENPEVQSWWEKVKMWFLGMLHDIGEIGFDPAQALTDNELRYMLWRSYKNLTEPGRYRSFVDTAEDVSMQWSLKVGDYEEEATDNYDLGEEHRREYLQSAETDHGALFRDGDVTERDRVVARDAYERRVASGWSQFKEAMQDSMLSLKEGMLAIMGGKGRIEDIPGNENAWLAENAMSSVNAAEQTDYYHTWMQPLLKAVHDICGNDEAKRQEMTDYMMAKHGLERNVKFAERDAMEAAKKGADYTQAYNANRNKDYAGLTALTGESDVTTAELMASLMVADFEAKHDTTELWEKVNDATKSTLAKLYVSGIISKETYEYVRDMFDNYIPLRGFDETTSEDVYGYLTSNAALNGSIMKHAEGRSSKSDDPIATIGLMADTAIRQANRNEMKKRFLNFVLNHPSDLVSVNPLWLEYDSAHNEWIPVFADIDASDTPEQVEKKVEAFEQKMAQLAAQHPDKYKSGADAVNIPYKVMDGNMREHQVLVRRGGETYVLTVNGNPRMAQALNGLTNPDVNVGGVIGNMLKLGEAVNHQLSAFYTTRTPDFVVSNFFRDMLYSNCMTWVKESPSYAVKFHKNFGKVNPVTMRRLFGKWEKGTLDDSVPMEMMFKQFMLNGGETGYTNIRDIEAQKRAIAEELKRQGSVPRKAWHALGMQLDLLNRSVENCARFAAFLTSMEMGRSVDRSIYDAKEVSVNFNKKGAGGKMVNATGQTFAGKIGSYMSGGGRLLYVFWNAGVQGMTNFGRAAKREPVKFTAGAATMFTLGVVIPMLAQMMSGGSDGDDDDENAYYNIPEYVRRNNICIRAGKQWLTIPLPIEFRAIYGLGELATGAVTGKERYDGGELAKQVTSQVSQILPLDFMEGSGGMHAFTPSVAKPFVEAYSNKAWTGLPIYRDNPFNQKDPEFTKVYKSADKYIVGASRMLNEATGGDDYMKGWADVVNPSQVEYVLNGYFGGWFKVPNQLIKMTETAFGQRDFEWRNMMLANRLVKSGDERTAYRKLQNEYFNYKEEYENTKRLLKKYENAADEGVLKYAEKLDYLNNSPEYARYEIFDKYNGDIETLYDLQEGEEDSETRKAYEAEYYELIGEMMKELRAVEEK